MSSADQSLKRTASPEAEEAQPNKRQKPDDNSDVPGAVAHIEESASGAAPAAALGEGTQAKEARLDQEQNQPDNNVDMSDTVPQLEESVAGAATGAHAEETPTDPDTVASTGNVVAASKNVRARPRPTRKECMKIVKKITAHGNNTGFFSEELKKNGYNSRPQMLPDERKQLMEDFSEQSATSGTQGQPEVGLDFMSEFSTAVDSPKDAATFLGIELQSLDISPKSALRLRIDQVQNVAFMVKKAEGILKGCVNANDYGTGKTIEALASIFFLAQRREGCSDSGTHKVAFILCPHQSLRGWQEAHEKYFSGLLTMRICSDSLPPGQHSHLIVPPSASGLAEFLATLLPSDPQTGRTVILCTYGELSGGLFMTKRAPEHAREVELSLHNSRLNEEAVEALKVSQKPELYDLKFDPAMIGMLIADEAHEIKDPKSQRAQAAYLLDTDIQFLLTPNPVGNRISDFRGLLFALYKSEEWRINWPENDDHKDVLRMFDDDFDPFDHDDSEDFIPSNASPQYLQALRNGQHLWRLNPHAYRWLGHYMEFGPEFARRVLGSIYRLCLLRRGVVSVANMPVGGSSTVSGILALPPVSIQTIEVSTGHVEQEYHDLASRGFDLVYSARETNPAAGAARVIKDNETALAAFNPSWDAFLAHITADVGLADVVGNSWPSDAPASRKSLPDSKHLKRNNKDSGMSFYYGMTRRETDPVGPPADRASMIRYLVRRSPKLRWLLAELDRLKQKGEKVIVYCVHPLTQWLVEGVCAMAEFNFLSLRSKPKHNDEVRTAVIDAFNNPAERYDFLLTTMRVLGHGVDLHADCHNMIIFELPDNIPTMLSAVGRIRRVSQTKAQEISILTMKNSYDDYTLHRQSRKHATSILAFGVLGGRLDELASRVGACAESARAEWLGRFTRAAQKKFLQKLGRQMPILDVVELLAAGELLRRYLGARYNTSCIPWEFRHKILFDYQGIHLEDFARAKMDFNTTTGVLILQLAAQLPATGPPDAGVGSLPARLED